MAVVVVELVDNGLKLYEIDAFILWTKNLFPGSLGVSERMSAAERASEASSAEQANERAVRANERTDERVAQYSVCLFLNHSPHRALRFPSCGGVPPGTDVGSGGSGGGEDERVVAFAVRMPLTLADGAEGQVAGWASDGLTRRRFLLAAHDAGKAAAQWGRTAKNRDVSTGPLARPFARLLAPLSHLPHCLLRSRALLRSFVHLLAHSLTPELVGKEYG